MLFTQLNKLDLWVLGKHEIGKHEQRTYLHLKIKVRLPLNRSTLRIIYITAKQLVGHGKTKA